MKMRRVVVTGIGCVTPVGNTVEATWSALLKGQSGIETIKGFDTDGFAVTFGGEIKDFDITEYITPKEAKKWTRSFTMGWQRARKRSKTPVWK